MLSDVIHDRIAGTFTGWDGETSFKLTNGQIWEQASYAYWYHYAYRPEIIISNSSGRWLLQLVGKDRQLHVRRVR